VREDVLDQLGGAPPDSLLVDLDQVLSVSYSFVDEFIGEFAAKNDGNPPAFANVPPTAARAIARSLANRGFEVPQDLVAGMPKRTARARAAAGRRPVTRRHTAA